MVPFQGPTSFIPIVWLAFASSSYLDKNTKSVVPAYMDGERLVLEVEISSQSDRVRLAQKIAFYKSASEDESASSLPSKPHVPENEDAVYHVLEFTNINGFSLPLSFELTAFRKPRPGEDPGGQYPRMKWTARVNRINPQCSIDTFVPRLSPDHNILIDDRRLQLPRTTPGGDGIIIKTNKWPTSFDLTNSPDFSRFMSMRESTLASGSGAVIEYRNGFKTVRWKGARKLDGTVAAPLPPPAYSGPHIYDESADGVAQIAESVALAKKQNKRIMLQFGANWSGWCHKLHKLFQSNPDVRGKLERDYLVVLIDVNGGHNRNLTTRYGGEELGLPFIVILDADGHFLTIKNTADLEEGDHHSPEKVLSFLYQWSSEK